MVSGSWWALSNGHSSRPSRPLPGLAPGTQAHSSGAVALRDRGEPQGARDPEVPAKRQLWTPERRLGLHDPPGLARPGEPRRLVAGHGHCHLETTPEPAAPASEQGHCGNDQKSLGPSLLTTGGKVLRSQTWNGCKAGGGGGLRASVSSSDRSPRGSPCAGKGQAALKPAPAQHQRGTEPPGGCEEAWTAGHKHAHVTVPRAHPLPEHLPGADTALRATVTTTRHTWPASRAFTSQGELEGHGKGHSRRHEGVHGAGCP